MKIMNVPDGWKIYDLKDIVWFQEGPGVRKWQYRDSGIKLLNVKNIVEGKLVLDNTSLYLSNEEIKNKYNHFLVDEGDLIIASSGIKVEYFHKKIAFVEKNHLPLCMNTSTIRFKSLNSEILDLRYFYYFLKTNIMKIQIKYHITGSAQLNFGPSHLSKMKAIVPPLKTQKEIIDILEKIEKTIKMKKEANRFLDEYLKSVFMHMFGDPVKNSKGWKIKKLGEISSVGSSKRVFVDELVEEGVPFYRGTEIGALSIEDNIIPTLFITEQHYNRLRESTRVPSIGDLLMPSICPDGRIWCVNTEKPFYFKDGRVLWIHLENFDIESVYLQYMLREKLIKDYNKIASGTTFAELKIFALKGIDIMIPPLELQNKFVLIVEKTKAMKEKNNKLLKELHNLFESLIQKTFKVQLKFK